MSVYTSVHSSRRRNGSPSCVCVFSLHLGGHEGHAQVRVTLGFIAVLAVWRLVVGGMTEGLLCCLSTGSGVQSQSIMLSELSFSRNCSISRRFSRPREIAVVVLKVSDLEGRAAILLRISETDRVAEWRLVIKSDDPL